jgi:hypothetical protein
MATTKRNTWGDKQFGNFPEREKRMGVSLNRMKAETVLPAE